MNDKVLRLLGLAQNAGYLASGTTAVSQAIKRGRVHLLYASTECSEGSLNKIQGQLSQERIIRHYGVEELSRAIGKNNRHFIAVLDAPMAEAMIAEIEKRR